MNIFKSIMAAKVYTRFYTRVEITNIKYNLVDFEKNSPDPL